MRQRIVGLATERLRKEERELLAWDLVCVELTKRKGYLQIDIGRKDAEGNLCFTQQV